MRQSLAVCWRTHHLIIEKDVSEAYQYYLGLPLLKLDHFDGSLLAFLLIQDHFMEQKWLKMQ